MRPIDADAMIRRFHDSPTFEMSEFLRTLAIDFVKEAPTIDAVPVVRCRECIHWVGDFPGATKYVKRCEWAGYMVGENGYCVYGERKEADHE